MFKYVTSQTIFRHLPVVVVFYKVIPYVTSQTILKHLPVVVVGAFVVVVVRVVVDVVGAENLKKEKL